MWYSTGGKFVFFRRCLIYWLNKSTVSFDNVTFFQWIGRFKSLINSNHNFHAIKSVDLFVKVTSMMKLQTKGLICMYNTAYVRYNLIRFYLQQKLLSNNVRQIGLNITVQKAVRFHEMYAHTVEITWNLSFLGCRFLQSRGCIGWLTGDRPTTRSIAQNFFAQINFKSSRTSSSYSCSPITFWKGKK